MKNILRVFALAILFVVISACGPAPRPTPIPPKSLVSPSKIEGVWTLYTVLQLSERADVQWECSVPGACGSQCVVEQLPEVVEQVGTPTRRVAHTNDYYRESWGTQAYKYDWFYGATKYQLKTERVENGDGTYTVSEESLTGCWNSDEETFWGKSLDECDLTMTSTTYKRWPYVLKGFCQSGGFDVFATTPAYSSYQDVDSKASLHFSGDVQIYRRGVSVKSLHYDDSERYKAAKDCKIILDNKEEYSGVSCP